MAKATGEISPRANECLEDIRREKIEGIIHPMITYEFLLQYHKKRLPIFRETTEVLDFLETHFSTVKISNELASAAAEIKSRSIALLARLKRYLSACDSLTIAVAKQTGSPIVSGDRDLRVVAEMENVKVIW